MMPNAALDLLNELGFEHAGEPLLTEDVDGSYRLDPLVRAAIGAITQDMTPPAGSV